jgi:hypothetical protein
MSAKVQDNDLEIDEEIRSSAASAPARYFCKVFLPSVGASWVKQ